MTKSVFISGISGSGKSTVCAALAERGYEAHDLEEMHELFTMIDPETGEPFEDFNHNDLDMVQRLEYVCDAEQVRELIRETTESIVFFGFSAANLEELLPLFDEVVQLTASHESIRNRLGNRTTNTFGREPEIRDWILTHKDAWEASFRDEATIVIDTDQDLQDTVTEILNAVRE